MGFRLLLQVSFRPPQALQPLRDGWSAWAGAPSERDHAAWSLRSFSMMTFLKPSFPTCPIFIAVFFDEGNEPPNQASRVRLPETLAVGVDDSAMSQTRSQTSLDEFRDRIHIAADQRPAVTIQRFEQWRVR
jgi:hypothetical protein